MDDGDRTRDTWSHSPVLYQLSYIHHHVLGSPRKQDSRLARLEGIEPPTDGLEIRCSILLSYRRGFFGSLDPVPWFRTGGMKRSGSSQRVARYGPPEKVGLPSVFGAWSPRLMRSPNGETSRG